MSEPDVALTDYAVALECLLFLVLIQRQRASSLRSWFTLLFASVGLASFIGGTVHGFFADEQSNGFAVLWRATMLTVGLTTLSMWAIAARILFSTGAARWLLVAATLQLAMYSLTVLFVSHEFLVAVCNYLPAVIFLLAALALAYHRYGQGSMLLAAGGLGMTLVASLLQQLQVGIHAAYFNHNALFHVLQGVALFLLFVAARGLIAAEQRAPASNAREIPGVVPA